MRELVGVTDINWEQATAEPKDLYPIKGATYGDRYDNGASVSEFITKLSDFFNVNLK